MLDFKHKKTIKCWNEISGAFMKVIPSDDMEKWFDFFGLLEKRLLKLENDLLSLQKKKL